MTNLALDIFDKDLEYSLTTTGLVNGLHTAGIRAVDLSDLHRSALVQAVSALDSFFCSEIQRLIVEITLGRRQANERRIDLRCTTNDLHRLLSADTDDEKEIHLKSIVADSFQRKTYQKSSDISEALGWVGIADSWNRAFANEAKQLRAELDAVVERRNSIVHDADRDPTYASSNRLSIRGDDTLAAVKTVRKVVHGISTLF